MMQKIIIFTDFHFYRLENGFLRDLNRLLLNSVTFDEQYVHIVMRISCETPSNLIEMAFWKFTPNEF